MKSTYIGWQDLQTLQTKEILSELSESKDNCRASLIISSTGLGKTNTVKLFAKRNPANTYVITVGDSYRLTDIVTDLMKMLGIGKDHKGYAMPAAQKRMRLMQIAERLKQIREEGGSPMLILDESENMKMSTLKMIKELYDAIIEFCSITLIGTDQIIDAMIHPNSKKQSVPQVYRRFKAGIRYIAPIKKSRDFKPFFEKHIPGNTEVQDILLQLCENYGELHDFLDPVLRYCSKNDKQLDAQIFRFFHKLPEPGNHGIIKQAKNAA